MSNIEAKVLIPLLAGDAPTVFEKTEDSGRRSPSDEDDEDTVLIAALPVEATTRGDAIEWVCKRSDLFCRVENGVLAVREYETRSYILSAQPGTYANSMTMNSLQSSWDRRLPRIHPIHTNR